MLFMRYFSLVALSFLTLFFAACAGESTPPPTCEGDACPVPCKDAGIAPIGHIPSNGFTTESTIKNCYTPGESQTSFIKTRPIQANFNAPKTVVVFDVVSRDQGEKYPSVVRQVLDISNVKINPDVFREPVPTTTITTGLEATFSFKINNAAPAGNYYFVISFFRLQDGQSANQVTSDPNALAGRILLAFKVEK